MSALYELTGQYEYLMNCLYNDDYNEQALIDTLDGIEGEIEEKAEGYAKILKQLEKDAAAYKAEEQRMAERRKALENRQGWLKSRLYRAMKATGRTKFKTSLFSFEIQKNGGKRTLIIDAPDQVPAEYLIPQPPKVDSDKVRELLKDQEVSWAHLGPQGESLRIR